MSEMEGLVECIDKNDRFRGAMRRVVSLVLSDYTLVEEHRRDVIRAVLAAAPPAAPAAAFVKAVEVEDDPIEQLKRMEAYQAKLFEGWLEHTLYLEEKIATLETGIAARAALAAARPAAPDAGAEPVAWQELWMSLNGLDSASAEEQAEIMLQQCLEGTQIGDGNRTQIRSYLVDHLKAAEARASVRLSADQLAAKERETIERAANRLRSLQKATSHGTVAWQALVTVEDAIRALTTNGGEADAD